MTRERTGQRSATESPMMTQYLRAKAEHPGSILLFRMGDFYETFLEDAHVLARETGIALTSRNPKDADPIPLAGFPWHSAEGHIAKLLRAGHRVAICEQVEEPGAGKKLLERRVVEVLSPGTTLGDSLLEASSNNFIAALRLDGARVGLAAADVSTGELRVGDLGREEAGEELARLAPSEIILVESERETLDPWLAALDLPRAPFRTYLDPWRFGRERAMRALLEQLRVASLEPFECEDLGPSLGAAGALLEYAREQKQSELGHLRLLRRIRPNEGLVLDESTLRSLEVLEPMPGASRDSTLVAVLDETKTAAGARFLRAALRRPLRDRAAIEARQRGVTAWLDLAKRSALRAALAETSDLERILARLHCGKSGPRDLAALRNSLRVAPRVESLRDAVESATGLPTFATGPLNELAAMLGSALVDDPPTSLADGGVFRDEWDAELGEVRSLARDAKGWIARLQEEERRATGIPGLKVGFNRVFGYFIEVSQSQLGKVPERYTRKQTLAGAERYLTPELKEFEEKVLRAEESQLRRERVLFDQLCARIKEETAALQRLAAALAQLDFLQALSEVAARYEWTLPELRDDLCLEIREGRHPVVELAVGRDRFVPNDLLLDGEAQQLVVLTGPNMAGKSTYLRQIGLLVLLAQIGSYVPAREAKIGLVDRIFTRVGAQDALARGQSTFLVEMIETSRILHHAGRRSLVLLDEVGRGTSTYDGLAIAWAVSEALAAVDGPRPRTIFATHFHELTRLAREGNGVINRNVEVKEWGDRVVFLHRIVDGGADRSYGIHVASLAGVPDTVIARAREVLSHLEDGARRDLEPETGPARPRTNQIEQLSLFGEPAFARELRALDLAAITPIEAHSLLHRYQTELKR